MATFRAISDTALDAIRDAFNAALGDAEGFKNDAETAATNAEGFKNEAQTIVDEFGDMGDVQFHDSNVTVTVGPTKDFATVNLALEALTKAFYPVYSNAGVTATIVLDDDFEMAEQVLVRDVDLGWINITNESGTNGADIEGITAGTEITAPVAQQGTVTLDEYGGGEDKAIFDDLVIQLQGGDGSRFYFWNSAGSDPSLPGTGVEVNTSADTTEAEIAERFRLSINGETEFGATRSGRVITVVNADAGEATWSVTGRATLNVTTPGVTGVNYARFASTGHGFDVGDLVAIKDQEGVLEERNYDGLYVIAAVDTDWIELDTQAGDEVVFDADLAGTGDTGRFTRLIPITVKRESLTTEFEFFYYPAFGVARGTLPRISCLFEMDESGDPETITGTVYQSYLDGLCATDQGKIAVDPFCGFIGAHATNLYGTRNSEINANDGIFDRGGRYGIWAYSASVINARRAYANDCGWVAQALNKPRIDEIDEISGAGIVATRGSIINADKAQANDAYADCVHSEHGATISAPDVIAISSEIGELIGTRYGGSVSITRSFTLDPMFTPGSNRQPYSDKERGYLGALKGQAITTPLLRQGISGVQVFYERQTIGNRQNVKPRIEDPLYFPPYIISARNRKIIWYPYFYYGERFEEITGGYSFIDATNLFLSAVSPSDRTNMRDSLLLGFSQMNRGLPRPSLFSNKKIDVTNISNISITYDTDRFTGGGPDEARLALISERKSIEGTGDPNVIVTQDLREPNGTFYTKNMNVSSISGEYYIGIWTLSEDATNRRMGVYIRELYGEE